MTLSQKESLFISLFKNDPNIKIYELLFGVNRLYYECSYLLNAIDQLNKKGRLIKDQKSVEYFFLHKVITESYIILAHKILNTGQNNFQINLLINKVREAFPDKMDKLDSIRKDISNFEPTVQKPVKDIRNNLIAHLDTEYRNFTPEFYGVFHFQIFSHIKEAIDIMNQGLALPSVFCYQNFSEVGINKIFDVLYDSGILNS